MAGDAERGVRALTARFVTLGGGRGGSYAFDVFGLYDAAVVATGGVFPSVTG